ncbi:MAG: hypothetical protein K8R40_11730 [Anaerolineaceae bacterium]|nr:hypothetical protein [Anaerolineaceae bacterium]
MSVWFLHYFKFIVGISLGLWFSFFPQAASNAVELTAPIDGEVLKGNVTISGNTSVIGFESYDLLFSFENGSNDGDRFLITQSKSKVENGVLGTWDTAKVTDGDYRLFLVVHYEDDKPETVFVRDLRVRNYSPVEVESEAEQNQTEATETVFLETPTPESEETEPTLFGSMLRGMLYTVIAIVVIGVLIFGYTQKRRHR